MDGGVEGIFIYPLETIELILPVLVDEYLFCISSQDAFQGALRAEKGRGIKEGEGLFGRVKKGRRGEIGKGGYEVAEAIKVRLIKYINCQKQEAPTYDRPELHYF